MKQFSAPVENASTVPNHVHSFVVYWRTIPVQYSSSGDNR
ncbi:hypothetical protein CU024_0939 [Enterococcus faecium]|nr:hypothetical protein [Enterococcus faecium]MBK4759925.1 hypothetical protein [Enterococcus faecium]MBK4844612.1 hypothetical protein [Enterococcus faecium]MBK4848114.1 hypothetical protein [Enterococcus faecium]MBK4849939.1 hypothetical protein [Enterococcus faecium]